MNNIFTLIEKNKINWEEIYNKSINNLIDGEECDINVVVGFRGRHNFILPLIDSFNSAFEYYNNISETKKKFVLTFVEHDYKPNNIDKINKKANYFWSLGNVHEQFNRSFCFNYAFKYSNNSKYYLLHDLDILVKKNFFIELFENLGEAKCLQSYGNRHIWYMSKELTEKFLNKEISIDDIDKTHREVSAPEFKNSKGGSILVEKDTYKKVGGFDPELFWGYAAEDQMFWQKVLFLFGDIKYSDNPCIDMFHMWHEPTHNTNPLINVMNNSLLEFNTISADDKIKFLNAKCQLI